MKIHQVSPSSVLKLESYGERKKKKKAAKHLLAFCQALDRLPREVVELPNLEVATRAGTKQGTVANPHPDLRSSSLCCSR